jgi:hypothetical protein
MADIKKEVTKRVQFLRRTTVARHIPGEVPAKQELQEFQKDSTEEFGELLAISLVRGKNAKFVSKDEQLKFDESEKSRLESGLYLNDRERDAWLKTQGVEIQQLA